MDISNLTLSGLDLSKSDLSGFKVQAQTLCRAEGLDTVEGISDEIRAEAKAMKPFIERLDQLQEQKTKLQQNPSVTDRLKCFFKHGPKGVGGEIDNIDKKIEATQEAMVRSATTGMSIDRQKEVVKQFKDLDQELGRKIAQAHNAGGQLAQSNALQVKSRDDYTADEKKLAKLAVKEEKLKEERVSVKDALKKENRVLKAMEKVDSPKESQTRGPRV